MAVNWRGGPLMVPEELEEDKNGFMRHDLDRVLRVVSGDVALSWELYEYMYGPERVTFADFRWMARNLMNDMGPDTLGPEQDGAAGMNTVRRHFGEAFNATTQFSVGLFAEPRVKKVIEKNQQGELNMEKTNTGQGFDTFPPEIWLKIIETMDNPYDVENFCLAYECARPLVDSHLKKLKEKEALLLVMQSGFISAKTGLNMRLVSKKWCETTNEFYNRPHGPWTSYLPDNYFPQVTIKAPLDEAGARRIEEFIGNQDCQFIGGRVRLFACRTREPVQSPVEDESFQSIWKRARHLTVIYSWQLNNAEVLDICRPFLRHMDNLKSISALFPQKLLQCLPNLEKLEVIQAVDNNEFFRHEDYDYEDDEADWMKVLQTCKSNLKIFKCTLLTERMRNAANHMTFESLEELHVRNFERDFVFWTTLNHIGEDAVKIEFPKLKRIAIPIFSDYRYNPWSDEEDWILPWVLMEVSNNVETLQEIQILDIFNCNRIYGHDDDDDDDYTYWIKGHPIDPHIIGRGSCNVRNLVFEVTGKLDSDFQQWCFTLARVWPSLRFLQIFNKSGNGVAVGRKHQFWYNKRSDVWEVVQAGRNFAKCC